MLEAGANRSSKVSLTLRRTLLSSENGRPEELCLLRLRLVGRKFLLIVGRKDHERATVGVVDHEDIEQAGDDGVDGAHFEHVVAIVVPLGELIGMADGVM